MRGWPRVAAVVAIAVVVGIGGVLAVEAVTGLKPGATPSPSTFEAAVTGATAAIPTPSFAASTPSGTDVPRATPTLLSTPRPTTPPLPRAVEIARQGCYTGREPDGVPSGECTLTVTWNDAVDAGTEIRIFGVTGCLSAGEVAGDGSCLVVNTPLPEGSLELIAKTAGSRGRVSWTRPAWQELISGDTGGPAFWAFGVDGDGNDIYYAIVAAAYNSAGHSKFVIVDAGTWCYDTGCEGP